MINVALVLSLLLTGSPETTKVCDLPRAMEAPTFLEAAEVPQSLEAGMKRLEELFGEYDTENARLWWISNIRCTDYRAPVTKDEGADGSKKQAAESGPKMVDMRSILKDRISYGTPIRRGNFISIDSVSLRRSWTYRESDSGSWESATSQMRHSARRYSFRPSSKSTWVVEAKTLTHSNPNYIESGGYRGTVQWLEDGIRITSLGMDGAYGADGTVIELPIKAVRDFRVIDGNLWIDGEYQFYEMAESDGSLVATPDYSRPWGPKSFFRYRDSSNSLGEPPSGTLDSH